RFVIGVVGQHRGDVVGRSDRGKVQRRAAETTKVDSGERLRKIGWQRLRLRRHRSQSGSISKLMSAAAAEWVSAPTDTKSAPVAASCGIRSSVTPPEISTWACPCTRLTAWRI